MYGTVVVIFKNVFVKEEDFSDVLNGDDVLAILGLVDESNDLRVRKRELVLSRLVLNSPVIYRRPCDLIFIKRADRYPPCCQREQYKETKKSYEPALASYEST